MLVNGRVVTVAAGRAVAREAAKNFCPGRVLLLQRGRLLSLALLWS